MLVVLSQVDQSYDLSRELVSRSRHSDPYFHCLPAPHRVRHEWVPKKKPAIIECTTRQMPHGPAFLGAPGPTIEITLELLNAIEQALAVVTHFSP